MEAKSLVALLHSKDEIILEKALITISNSAAFTSNQVRKFQIIKKIYSSHDMTLNLLHKSLKCYNNHITNFYNIELLIFLKPYSTLSLVRNFKYLKNNYTIYIKLFYLSGPLKRKWLSD